MKERDFSDCEFIEDYLKYYTFGDFYDNKEIIKYRFHQLSRNAKKFYCWYVYANNHMNLTCKDAIWEYLNDDWNILDRLNEKYGNR